MNRSEAETVFSDSLVAHVAQYRTDKPALDDVHPFHGSTFRVYPDDVPDASGDNGYVHWSSMHEVLASVRASVMDTLDAMGLFDDICDGC